MCISLVGGISYAYAMLEGDSILYAIGLHSLNNLSSIILGTAKLTSFQERLVEILISIPSIIYLCLYTRKNKIKVES